MLSELLEVLGVVLAIAVVILLVYTRRQSAQVQSLEAGNAFQDGVKAQLTEALKDQQVKQEQEAKADEVIAKTASHDAAAAAKLLNSLTPGSGS